MTGRGLPRVLAVALAGAQAVLLARSAVLHSPTMNEPGHLAAGLLAWQTGDFRLYPVNPPLVKLMASAPVAAARPATDWSALDFRSGARSESAVGIAFVSANPRHWAAYCTLARWACIPLATLGAYFCWRWARDLWGEPAGLCAVALWCLDPLVDGWGATITADCGAAALGTAANYAFWRWLRDPGWRWTMAAGILLGLAQLTKFTWLVLLATWPATWLAWRLFPARAPGTGAGQFNQRPSFARLISILFAAIYMVNVGYGFQGTFTRLNELQFVSRSLAGGEQPLSGGAGANRFSGSLLAGLPIPVPSPYLLGIDLQKRDFERDFPHFLNGRWKPGGWWYFYLVALGVKVPLGTLVLFALALLWPLAELGQALLGRRRFMAAPRAGASTDAETPGSSGPTWRDHLVLLGPCVAVLILLSVNHQVAQSRYALVCLPFLFIWIARLASGAPRPQRRAAHAAPAGQTARATGLRGAATAACLVWSGISSLSLFPHHLSYFNELVGGPAHGHHNLLETAVESGQDLFLLVGWQERNPQAQPFYVHVTTSIALSNLNLKFERRWPPSRIHMPEPVPHGANGARPDQDTIDRRCDLLEPGWYAIGLNALHDRWGENRCLLECHEPVATAGYSIRIYHVSSERIEGRCGAAGTTREQQARSQPAAE